MEGGRQCRHYHPSSRHPVALISRGILFPGRDRVFPLDFGYNHGRDCCMMLGAAMEMVVYSRDVTWHQTREPLIPRARTSEAGTSHHAPAPEFVFISAPAAAPILTTAEFPYMV